MSDERQDGPGPEPGQRPEDAPVEATDLGDVESERIDVREIDTSAERIDIREVDTSAERIDIREVGQRLSDGLHHPVPSDAEEEAPEDEG